MKGRSCADAENKFPVEYVPTVFDNYSADTIVDGQPCSFELVDTAGQEDYERLRPLAYPGCHCVLMCYGVVDPAGSRVLFNNLKKWMAEVRNCKEWGSGHGARTGRATCHRAAFHEVISHGASGCDKENLPVILVGTMMDRRGEVGASPISAQEVNDMAKELGAHSARQCSAKTTVSTCS